MIIIQNIEVDFALSGKKNLISINWIGSHSRLILIKSKMFEYKQSINFVEKSIQHEAITHILLIYKSSSQKYAVRVVENMIRRCQGIINNDGDCTHYYYKNTLVLIE